MVENGCMYLDLFEYVLCLFLKDIIHHGSGNPTYDGWFCGLFVSSREDSCKEELLVADVHSSPPDDFDPPGKVSFEDDLSSEGHVLHEAVGNINLMTMSINSGEDKTMYRSIVKLW
jgi:hypothetical protein